MAKKNDETKKEVAPVKQKKEVSKKEPAKTVQNLVKRSRNN